MSEEKDLLFRKYIGFYEYVTSSELLSWVRRMSDEDVSAELKARGWSQ